MTTRESLIAGALAPYLEARSAAALRPAEPSVAAAALAACRLLSQALDASMRALAREHAASEVAVVAVGGYGRQEQSRHSDIDVMLLVPGADTARATAMLYPLWDAALKVGHSIRTTAQALEAARANLETFTALLDARFVCGDRALFDRFQQQFAGLVRGRQAWLHESLVEQRRELILREPWQLQEADVKNGRGGMRTLQAARWLDTAEALARQQEAPPLPPALVDAKETLLATRNALHALAERQNDRYLNDLGDPVAEWLGVERRGWERRLLEAMRVIDAHAEARLATPALGLPGNGSGLRGVFRRLVGRNAGASAPVAPAAVPAAPRTEVETSDLSRLLAELRSLDPRRFDPLPRSEWLGRLLPEWEVLRCLPHVAAFHRHPVDVHAWRTVEEATFALRADTEETGTAIAAAELPDRDEVLLAALLHDIGKGHEGDHSAVGAVIAERFGTRAGLEAETIRRLSDVAAMHLLLPTVATRRDIADPRVIRETAEQVRDTRLLHLLYVISVADARASGPDVWSPWKAQLMRSLYLRVLDVLAEVRPEEETVALLAQRAVEALDGTVPAAVVRAHIEQLPPSYLLSTPFEAVGHHLAMIAQAAGGTAVRRDTIGSVERVTVVTPDRPGILSLVAGTLAVHNASVLGGTAFTRDDGVAIEVFHVSDALGHGIDERRWARIAEAIPLALAGDFPVAERLAETRAAYHAVPRVQMDTVVHVDNAGSDRYSIVEVTTADRLGLLFAITNVLHDLALDIHLAKVDTVGAEVVDAFYVLRQNGRRIEDADEVERIERRIREAVHALDEV